MQTEIQDSHSLDEICSQFSLPALLTYWIGHSYDHDWWHFIGHLLDLFKCYLVHPWGGRKDWIAFWSSTAVPEPGLVITFTTSNLKNEGTTWISGAMENKWYINVYDGHLIIETWEPLDRCRSSFVHKEKDGCIQVWEPGKRTLSRFFNIERLFLDVCLQHVVVNVGNVDHFRKRVSESIRIHSDPFGSSGCGSSILSWFAHSFVLDYSALSCASAALAALAALAWEPRHCSFLWDRYARGILYQGNG